MAINLVLESSTPARQQYELDRLTLHYRSDQPWNVTVIDPSVPQKGDAHPDFRFLFVSDIQLTESGDRQCAFDVIYQGAFFDTGGDFPEPILPPNPNESDNAVMSASSKTNRVGQVLTSPVTTQFYAPTTKVTWFTYLSKGTSETLEDPPPVTEFIKIEIGDTAYQVTGTIAELVSFFFQPLVVRSVKSTEVVSGKYWKNTEQKTSTLSAWILTIPTLPGNFIFGYGQGSGYTVGDILSIATHGGSASMRVDLVAIGGGVFEYTTLSNTITVNTFPPATPATGGTGHGAAFYNLHIE